VIHEAAEQRGKRQPCTQAPHCGSFRTDPLS
jgi:hypothetical protein